METKDRTGTFHAINLCYCEKEFVVKWFEMLKSKNYIGASSFLLHFD